MTKLTAQGSSQNIPFKPIIYQGKRREHARYYYNQDRYQSRYRLNSRRISYRGRAQYGQNYRGRSQYDQNYRGDFRKGNFKGTQNFRGQNFRSGYRGSFRHDNFGRGRSRSRESIQVTLEEMIEAAVDQDQVKEQVPIEIELYALNVGSMITLLKIVQIYQKQKKRVVRADKANA